MSQKNSFVSKDSRTQTASTYLFPFDEISNSLNEWDDGWPYLELETNTETVYRPLFSCKILRAAYYIPVASVVGAKGGGVEGEKRVPPFFPSPKAPSPFHACFQATY